MKCSGVRKAPCEKMTNCDWIKNNGCKNKSDAPKNVASNANTDNVKKSKNVKKQIETILEKIRKTKSSIYFKSGGKQNDYDVAPFHKKTNEVDYFTGNDYKMIMSGKIKSIVIVADTLSGGQFDTINKIYIQNNLQHVEHDPVSDDEPLEPGYGYFLKINMKALTYLTKQLEELQASEKVLLLPTIVNVKIAYKKQLKKTPPINMTIQTMLSEIVSSLQ
jgi:hypothetical protein